MVTRASRDAVGSSAKSSCQVTPSKQIIVFVCVWVIHHTVVAISVGTRPSKPNSFKWCFINITWGKLSVSVDQSRLAVFGYNYVTTSCVYWHVCCSVPGSRWWGGWSRAADWLRFGPLEAAGGFEPRAAADGCSPPSHSAARHATPPPRCRRSFAESAADAPVTWGQGGRWDGGRNEGEGVDGRWRDEGKGTGHK